MVENSANEVKPVVKPEAKRCNASNIIWLSFDFKVKEYV